MKKIKNSENFSRNCWLLAGGCYLFATIINLILNNYTLAIMFGITLIICIINIVLQIVLNKIS